ncbi:MAG: CoA pyrophosphatase [Planctomycetes bacterium]|nr:CoA pyrophosphatase [Planctomycetota bacterium]
MFDLPAIRTRLAGFTPALAAPPEEVGAHAAVALLLCQPAGAGTEVLLIRRSEREGDRWSGDVALPGGRREAGDQSIAATARREAFEEVGVRLEAPLARLDDYDVRRAPRAWPLVVTPFVFALDERPPVTPNHEVEQTIWTPLSALADARNATFCTFRRGTKEYTRPGVRCGRFIVWGITLHVLESFFRSLRVERYGAPAAPA